MDWDKLRIFHAVADAGSLTHAGEALHLSQSAVSRQIRALEEALDTTLFHRHARGLILTEQGELLFDATVAMAKRIDAATARIRDSEEEVFGELRVTTTTGFGSLWLAPRLSKLYDKYPDLNIDLMLEEYLERNGTPQSLEDMSKHRLICQNTRSAQVSAGLQLVQELLTYDIQATLSVNNYFGVLQAVISNLGIGVLPDYIIEDFPSVVRVLPDVESIEVPVFLAYPEELRHSKRIEAFRDFVQDEIIAHRKTRKAMGTA